MKLSLLLDMSPEYSVDTDLRDEDLLAGAGALDDEERGAVSTQQETQVDDDLVRQPLQVQVVGDVLHDVQEEVLLVLRPQLLLPVERDALKSREPYLGLDQEAEHVVGGGREGAVLPHGPVGWWRRV